MVIYQKSLAVKVTFEYGVDIIIVYSFGRSSQYM